MRFTSKSGNQNNTVEINLVNCGDDVDVYFNDCMVAAFEDGGLSILPLEEWEVEELTHKGVELEEKSDGQKVIKVTY